MLSKFAKRATALAIAFVAAEIALRVANAPPPIPSREHASLPGGLKLIQNLTDLVQPKQRGLFRGALYETNVLGLRDRDYVVPKPRGVFRIVVAGGSTTMGSWIAEDATWAARIEEQLNTDGPTRFEVVNTALAGADIKSALGRLEAFGLAYEPDLIIYGFSLTDIELGTTYRRGAVSTMPLPAGDSGSALLDSGFLALEEFRQIREAPGTYSDEIFTNYFENPELWMSYQSQLDRLAAIAKKRNACVLVLLQTHPLSLHILHPYRPAYHRVAEAAQTRGMSVAPSLDLYLGEEPRTLWASPIDLPPVSA